MATQPASISGSSSLLRAHGTGLQWLQGLSAKGPINFRASLHRISCGFLTSQHHKISSLMLKMEEGAQQGIVWWASGDELFLEDGESVEAVSVQQAETE